MAITRAAIRAAIPAVPVAAILALIGPSMTPASAATVTVRTVKVGAPGNPAVAVVPFTDAVYQACADAPRPPAAASRSAESTTIRDRAARDHGQAVGRVPEHGRPGGRDRHDLYDATESSSAWPKYGQINESGRRPAGASTTRSAYPEWADKPYGFANFLRAARFVNSLYNGRLLPRTPQRRRLRRLRQLQGPPLAQTEPRHVRPRPQQAHRRDPRAREGLRRPSQDEWIKAAYFDPTAAARTPTGSTRRTPASSATTPRRPQPDHARSHDRRRHERRDPAAGDLPRAGRRGAQLVPGRRPAQRLLERQPVRHRSDDLRQLLPGQPRHRRPGADRSPWGTLDQGGNAVEWTDTITPPPSGGATGESGAACTAASPTPPPTSCGSRRSACSPRTTRSTTSPIRGSGSGSAWSAT